MWYFNMFLEFPKDHFPLLVNYFVILYIISDLLIFTFILYHICNLLIFIISYIFVFFIVFIYFYIFYIFQTPWLSSQNYRPRYIYIYKYIRPGLARLASRPGGLVGLNEVNGFTTTPHNGDGSFDLTVMVSEIYRKN